MAIYAVPTLLITIASTKLSTLKTLRSVTIISSILFEFERINLSWKEFVVMGFIVKRSQVDSVWPSQVFLGWRPDVHAFCGAMMQSQVMPTAH